MTQLAQQFKVPGSEGQSETLVAPKGIPKELTGGLGTSGNNVIQTGLNILLMITAFLAIIVLMYSGIQMVTSAGDSDKLAAARKRIMFAVIGLVVAATAFFIVRVVFTVTGTNTDLLKNPAKILNASPQPAVSAKP